MKLVVPVGPGEVELNYMWLPTFIGMDTNVKKLIEEKVGPELVGKELTEDTLQFAHDLIVDTLCDRYKIEGLRDYLDSIKFVTT